MTRAESFPVPISSADQALVGGDADLGVIRLRGEHDIATVSALAATLSQAVASEGADVVVDWVDVAATERAQRCDDAVSGTYHRDSVPVVPAPVADSRRREAGAEAPAGHGAQ